MTKRSVKVAHHDRQPNSLTASDSNEPIGLEFLPKSLEERTMGD